LGCLGSWSNSGVKSRGDLGDSLESWKVSAGLMRSLCVGGTWDSSTDWAGCVGLGRECSGWGWIGREETEN